MRFPAATLIVDNVVAALVVVATAQASRWLGVPGNDLSVLGPPTAFMLGWGLRRGVPAMAGGAAGIALWSWFGGAGPLGMLLVTLAVTIPPLAGAQLLTAVRRWRPALTKSREMARLLLVAALLQAPMAALFGWLAMWDQPLARNSPIGFLLDGYLMECTSALVFAPALTVWIQPRGGRGRSLPAAVDPRIFDWPAIAFVMLVGALSVALHGMGHDEGARWLSVAAFFGPMFSALRTGPRSSTLVLALTAVLMLAIRARLFPLAPELVIEQGLVPAWLMLSIGSVFIHMLNAGSIERFMQARRLQEMALQSEVAGLPNVRALQQMLLRLTSKAVRRPFRVMELALPDVARFGDLAGRAAMLELEGLVAARLREAIGRRAPLIAHLTTGRFVLILPSTVSDEQIRDTVQRGIEEPPFRVAGRPVRLRPSVGIIDVQAGIRANPEAILAALSLAQQHAFNSGERFKKFPLTGNEIKQVWAELDLEETVKRAIAERRIRLLAQLIEPVRRQPGGAGLHYEVLSRMIDDHGNELAPAVFLPAVSRAGLAREFDYAVIQATLEYLARDSRLLAETRMCAINVTGPTICDPGFPDRLKAVLATTAIDPRIIMIEITESESIANFEVARRNVVSLNAHGLTIAVDDFGTGLATFDYLKRFRPQMLKIDGSFIRTYDDSLLDREIVQAIVRVAAAIGAHTVAEWVETDALGKQLKALGVDYLQGYSIARPAPIQSLLFADAAERARSARVSAEAG